MKFAPVVENHLGEGDQVFLTDYPKNILLSKDLELVPWMVGITTSEAAISAALFPEIFLAGEAKTVTSKTSNKLLPSWNCNGYCH
jgi:hypothetical protein